MKDKIIISKELEGRLDLSEENKQPESSVIPLSIWCNGTPFYTSIESARISMDSLSVSFHLRSDLTSMLLFSKVISLIEIGNTECRFENCNVKSLKVESMGDTYLCSLVVEICNTYNT
jgi:hypothetical protein|tara:strand:+ start:4540 stop:4893 length:354 start_codon:yes stop_codon:yes gene_type:complete